MEENREFTPAEKIRIAADILLEMGVTHAFIRDKELFVVDGNDFKALIGDMPVQEMDRGSENYPVEYCVMLPNGWKLYTLNYEKDE